MSQLSEAEQHVALAAVAKTAPRFVGICALSVLLRHLNEFRIFVELTVCYFSENWFCRKRMMGW